MLISCKTVEKGVYTTNSPVSVAIHNKLHFLQHCVVLYPSGSLNDSTLQILEQIHSHVEFILDRCHERNQGEIVALQLVLTRLCRNEPVLPPHA